MARIFETGELTLLEALVLAAAFFEDPKPVRPSQLAETFSTTRGNVSHCVSSLEAKGFLERRIDPGDARSFQLQLQPRGKKIAMGVIRTMDRMQKEFEKAIGAAALAAALEVVQRVERMCAERATSNRA